MFPPIFPIYIRALTPLYRYASLIWLGGVGCLWSTRYTHQLGKRWGSVFYIVSSIVRPAGVFLIGLGWLALYAPEEFYSQGYIPRMSLLPRNNLAEILCWLAIAGFFALGVWAALTLGLRRSFLFRRLDDPLVTTGPYAIVRHPQFLSVIGVTFFVIRLFDPTGFPMIPASLYHGSILNLNWALFALSLWILSIIEDRELEAHFGEEYREYVKKVPRILPN